MTTGKTIALTRRTFVGQVMSLPFNMLCRLVIALLPRSKRLLILWLQSLSAVILEPHKIKSLTVSIFFPSICHEVMGPDAMILVTEESLIEMRKRTHSLHFYAPHLKVILITYPSWSPPNGNPSCQPWDWVIEAVALGEKNMSSWGQARILKRHLQLGVGGLR